MGIGETCFHPTTVNLVREVISWREALTGAAAGCWQLTWPKKRLAERFISGIAFLLIILDRWSWYNIKAWAITFLNLFCITILSSFGQCRQCSLSAGPFDFFFLQHSRLWWQVYIFYRCPNIVLLLISNTDNNRYQAIPIYLVLELTHFGRVGLGCPSGCSDNDKCNNFKLLRPLCWNERPCFASMQFGGII